MTRIFALVQSMRISRRLVLPMTSRCFAVKLENRSDLTMVTQTTKSGEATWLFIFTIDVILQLSHNFSTILAEAVNLETMVTTSASNESSAACGTVDVIDDDEMEQEEMFVDPHNSLGHGKREWGGPCRGGRLPEPTRFGDWERKGRCTDF